MNALIAAIRWSAWLLLLLLLPPHLAAAAVAS